MIRNNLELTVGSGIMGVEGAFWLLGRLGLGLLMGWLRSLLMILFLLHLGSLGHVLDGLFARMFVCFCLLGVGFHLLGL